MWQVLACIFIMGAYFQSDGVVYPKTQKLLFWGFRGHIDRFYQPQTSSKSASPTITIGMARRSNILNSPYSDVAYKAFA